MNAMGRNWISVLIPHTRIRVGRSMSDSELFGTSQRREALPSWVRYEVSERMQAAAKTRGERWTKEYCNYKIDKAFALGELDRNGMPILHSRGANAEELAEQLIASAAEWGFEINHEQALAHAVKSIHRIEFRRFLPWIWVVAFVALVVIFWHLLPSLPS